MCEFTAKSKIYFDCCHWKLGVNLLSSFIFLKLDQSFFQFIPLTLALLVWTSGIPSSSSMISIVINQSRVWIRSFHEFLMIIPLILTQEITQIGISFINFINLLFAILFFILFSFMIQLQLEIFPAFVEVSCRVVPGFNAISISWPLIENLLGNICTFRVALACDSTWINLKNLF